jgi:hypothetical protein
MISRRCRRSLLVVVLVAVPLCVARSLLLLVDLGVSCFPSAPLGGHFRRCGRGGLGGRVDHGARRSSQRRATGIEPNARTRNNECPHADLDRRVTCRQSRHQQNRDNAELTISASLRPTGVAYLRLLNSAESVSEDKGSNLLAYEVCRFHQRLIGVHARESERRACTGHRHRARRTHTRCGESAEIIFAADAHSMHKVSTFLCALLHCISLPLACALSSCGSRASAAHSHVEREINTVMHKDSYACQLDHNFDAIVCVTSLGDTIHEWIGSMNGYNACITKGAEDRNGGRSGAPRRSEAAAKRALQCSKENLTRYFTARTPHPPHSPPALPHLPPLRPRPNRCPPHRPMRGPR